MKLYFSPGACSLSPHIVLREVGAKFDLEQVDLKEKKTKSGKNFLDINPKGQVPTLELDSGEVLTEGPVIVQYIADQYPSAGIAPKVGTMERLSCAGMAEFSHLGNPQELLAVVRANHARGIQNDRQGKPRQTLQVARQPFRQKPIPHGRKFHHRRCLCFHALELDQAGGDRSRAMAQSAGLS